MAKRPKKKEYLVLKKGVWYIMNAKKPDIKWEWPNASEILKKAINGS